MQVDFLNPVLNACRNVMLSMADLNIRTGRPELRKPGHPELGDTVTGLICMRSCNRCASIAIVFSQTALENIALRMLPDDTAPDEFLAFDLIGEISNMIIGGAKTELIKQGYDFQITLPTVISGYDYLIAHQTKAPILRIPLNCEIGIFHVEASFEGPPLTEAEKLENPVNDHDANPSTLELF